MKQLIYAVLLAILLSNACNSSKRVNIREILRDNRQTEELEAQFFDVSKENKQGFALPGLDHGLIQSPINILTKTVAHVDSRTITVRYKDEVDAVANLGHTIQLYFAEGSTISAHGKTFYFKQMHAFLSFILYPLPASSIQAIPDGMFDDTRNMPFSALHQNCYRFLQYFCS